MSVGGVVLRSDALASALIYSLILTVYTFSRTLLIDFVVKIKKSTENSFKQQEFAHRRMCKLIFWKTTISMVCRLPYLPLEQFRRLPYLQRFFNTNPLINMNNFTTNV